MATIPHSLTISFPRSTSTNYPVAVDLARTSADYHETGVGRQIRHHATFPICRDTIKTLARLVAQLAGLKAVEILVDGAPVRVDDLRGVFQCAATVAAAYDRPQDYCHADNWYYPAFDDLPTFPCARFTCFTNRIPWANEGTRVNAIHAALLDHGITWCPFLDLSLYLQKLAAWIPTSPDHRLNPLVPYRRRGISGTIGIDNLLEPGGPDHPDNQ